VKIAFIIIAAFVATVNLSACTVHTEINAVEIKQPKEQQRIAGRYAAFIQTGGWNLTAGTGHFAGGGYNVTLDINEAFQASLKKALSQTLHSVTYTKAAIPIENLSKRGYDNQILIHQGNAEARYSAEPFGWILQIYGYTQLATTVASLDKQGKITQNDVIGYGVNTQEEVLGFKRAEAVKAASEVAMRDLVKKIVATVRKQLASHGNSVGQKK
jgi:hypothetical protein